MNARTLCMTMRTYRGSILGLMLPPIVTLLILSLWQSVYAGDLGRVVEFHIAAQALDTALLEFSKQADTPIAVSAPAVDKLRTSGLQGKLSVRVALETLLRDSGLSYITVGDTLTVISPRASAKRNRS